jgi:hypothetical protein
MKGGINHGNACVSIVKLFLHKMELSLNILPDPEKHKKHL